MINKVHFGKRVASLRRSKKLSQVVLAEKLSVTPQAVSKWECGTALPDIELLLELSHLYNVSVNELLEDRNIIVKLANHPCIDVVSDGGGIGNTEGDRGKALKEVYRILKPAKNNHCIVTLTP